MHEKIKELITKLTQLTLYHATEIVQTEFELETYIHNDPKYDEILECTKEMNHIATAINSMDISLRMGAGLRYEEKQYRLKQLLEKLNATKD